jgi:hypothetical protein
MGMVRYCCLLYYGAEEPTHGNTDVLYVRYVFTMSKPFSYVLAWQHAQLADNCLLGTTDGCACPQCPANSWRVEEHRIAFGALWAQRNDVA